MGTIQYLFYYPDLSANKKFVKDFQAAYGNSPGFPAFNAYTTAQFIAEGFRKAGQIDKEKFIDAIEGLKVDTPVGKVEIRACDHQAVYPMLLGTTKISKEFGAPSPRISSPARSRGDASAKRSPRRASRNKRSLVCPPGPKPRRAELPGYGTQHHLRSGQPFLVVEPAMILFIVSSGLSLSWGFARAQRGPRIPLHDRRLHGPPLHGRRRRSLVWLAIFLAPLVVGLISLIAERLLFCHLYEREHLMLLLFTFALVLILGDLTKMTWGADYRSLVAPPFLQGSVSVLDTPFPKYNLFLLAVGPVVAVGLWFFSSKTKIGKMPKCGRGSRNGGAIGINELGVRVRVRNGMFRVKWRLVSPTVSITLG
jgi:hypothetical protein